MTNKKDKIVNAITAAQAADPWMIFHGGFYYYSESREGRQIWIRRSRTIAGISDDPGVCVWTAPVRGANSENIWAPELHLLEGKWFIYYAADNGDCEQRRMWVLECRGADPRGDYRCRGVLNTGGWAIDGTVMTVDNGRKFFLWSGWHSKRRGQQNIYIAPMKDPVTISGTRVAIATPDQSWERVDMPICEGPQVLRRNGDLFIVYSASGSWTPDYCLGLLRNKSGNVLDPAAWTKHGPVFRKTDQIWGVGHCSFVKSLCQNEDWIIYHPKAARNQPYEERNVHALQFEWSSDGFPDFGVNAPDNAPLLRPIKKRSKLGAVVASALLALGLTTVSVSAVQPKEKAPAVKVTTQRGEGGVTHFYVENDELCEITMSFEMGLVNLKGSTNFPYTTTFAPGKVTEAFTLTPTGCATNWEYNYTNFYKLGSACATHADEVVYQLPFAPGSRYKVTQGYNGGFSHKGSNLYAIDWQMPEGTQVFAARGGLVVKVKDDSNTGGSSMKYDLYNNYVLIRHEDGTLGHYCHLKKGGVCVKPGQSVRAGDRIALSGNTGFSSGPHLHFSVFKTKDGRQRISLPVKFRTMEEKATILVEGRKYKAAELPEVQTASAGGG